MDDKLTTKDKVIISGACIAMAIAYIAGVAGYNLVFNVGLLVSLGLLGIGLFRMRYGEKQVINSKGLVFFGGIVAFIAIVIIVTIVFPTDSGNVAAAPRC